MVKVALVFVCLTAKMLFVFVAVPSVSIMLLHKKHLYLTYVLTLSDLSSCLLFTKMYLVTKCWRICSSGFYVLLDGLYPYQRSLYWVLPFCCPSLTNVLIEYLFHWLFCSSGCSGQCSLYVLSSCWPECTSLAELHVSLLAFDMDILSMDSALRIKLGSTINVWSCTFKTGEGQSFCDCCSLGRPLLVVSASMPSMLAACQ